VIDVMTAKIAKIAEPRSTKMTTYTIDSENNITAFPTPDLAEAAVSSGAEAFASQKELAKLAGTWPPERLVGIWNSLPGVKPVKGFKTAKTAASRIWERIQGLGEAANPAPEAKPRAAKKARGGAQAAKGAPAKGKAGRKATAAKNPAKSKKAAKAVSAGPREGSKTAQVVALLQRKNGATLAEIMEKMDWQKHTVRGFMAGAMKKAGYNVESFKPDGGERTYRLNA
jgi:hypothetical protein